MTIRRCYMENKEDIINDLLKDIKQDESVEVELPSKGFLYKFEDEDKKVVYLRPMTFEDEKHLTMVQRSAKDPANLLLERCVSNLDVNQLTSSDKLYLILKLREISYGDTYDARVVCPKCNAEAEIGIDISNLPVKELPENFVDPVTVTLPKLGKEAKVRIPRVKDEQYFKNSKTASDQIWRFVTEVAGITDKSIIAELIKKLPLVDIKTIINAMGVQYGVETKIHYDCDFCGGGSIIDLPINENFFNVN